MAYPAVTTTRNNGSNTAVTETFEPFDPRSAGNTNRVQATEASPATLVVDGKDVANNQSITQTVQIPGQRPSGKP